MIAVDTSVWVSALRGGRGHPAPTLTALLDADEVVLPLPVRIELLAGVARSDRARLKRSLAALPVVRPWDQTWTLLESWVEPASDAGFRFGLTDLLVAALADEAGALVWSLDKDFERMAALNLVRLYSGHQWLDSQAPHRAGRINMSRAEQADDRAFRDNERRDEPEEGEKHRGDDAGPL